MGKGFEYTFFFSKEDIQMTNGYIKLYSTSLIIRKVQIKTIMRCCLILIGMTIVKRQKISSAVRDEEKKDPHAF